MRIIDKCVEEGFPIGDDWKESRGKIESPKEASRGKEAREQK